MSFRRINLEIVSDAWRPDESVEHHLGRFGLLANHTGSSCSGHPTYDIVGDEENILDFIWEYCQRDINEFHFVKSGLK